MGRSLLLTTCLWLGLPGVAEGYDLGCKTPQSAVYTLFHHLEASNYNEEKAAECFEAVPSVDDSPGVLARKLRSTLDARDIFVELDRLSTDPDHRDDNGRARQSLDPRLPELYVTKQGGRWILPAEVLARIPILFDESVLVDIESVTTHLPPWAQKELLGVATYKYIGLLLLLFLAVLVRFVVGAFVVSQIRGTMQRFGVDWGDALLGRVAKPLGTLAGSGVVAMLVPSLVLPIRFGQIVLLATEVVSVFSVVWVLYRLVDLFAEWMDQRAALTETKLDDQLVPLVRKALKIFIVAMGSIFILQNLDVDVAGLVAGLGIGGLAFALAAKDTVANVFGSATIFADRPFQVGDWINALGVDGTVETVGFRSTKIRTFYDSLVSIPNAKLADAVIDNYGARTFRRIYTRLGITYDTPVEHVQAFVEGIRAIIRANPFTRKDKYEIHFNDYGASALEIMLYCFVKAETWSIELRERHNILMEIHRLADSLGISFAFPTQTLHIESVAQSGQPLTVNRPPVESLPERVASFGPGGEQAKPEGIAIGPGYIPGPE
ncbi:MAG: mechanosensitive ion channel family protein [Myxococcota bacterium]